MNCPEEKQDRTKIKIFEWDEGKVVILPRKISLENLFFIAVAHFFSVHTGHSNSIVNRQRIN